MGWVQGGWRKIRSELAREAAAEEAAAEAAGVSNWFQLAEQKLHFQIGLILALTIPSNLPFECSDVSIDELTVSKCLDVSIDELTLSKCLDVLIDDLTVRKCLDELTVSKLLAQKVGRLQKLLLLLGHQAFQGLHLEIKGFQ